MRKLKRKSRPILLLEVLIAMVIIIFSILPLISAQSNMMKQQLHFVKMIELNEELANLYGEIVRQLYAREIPFEELLEGRKREIRLTSFPYEGTVTFKKHRAKVNKETGYGYYLIELEFEVEIEPGQTSRISRLIFVEKGGDE